MKTKILIGIFILLLLVGCDFKERCEEVAILDYDMKNPRCEHFIYTQSYQCQCADFIETENSIKQKDFSYKTFRLKNS